MRSRLPLVLAAATLALAAPPPVPVIFDTDMGNDIDDALALAMLHALEDRGECRLLAVTLTNPAPSAAAYTALVNHFYGRPGVAVGHSTATRKEGANRRFPDAALAAFPEFRPPATSPAVPLLRRTLAATPEKAVIVQVGFSDNLAALLASGPDEFSPLDGRALVAAKVSLLSIMAGDFASPKPEYNVRIDVAAARRVIGAWPGPVVLSGWEVGAALRYPARSILEDFRYASPHPVAVAYEAYAKMPYDRPTWDLTSVLQAVRPGAGYFQLSPPGRVEIADDGRTTFLPAAEGNQRYLVIPPGGHARILEALTLLSSQPPRRR